LLRDPRGRHPPPSSGLLVHRGYGAD
jgi:hypothetical protein